MPLVQTQPTDHERSTGARPLGQPDATPDTAADSVRGMFDEIAGAYDLLNYVLSAGIAALWWRRAARAVRGILLRPEARILDICCGTGDMTLALLHHRPSTASTAPLLAVDFSHQMLTRGYNKFHDQNVIALEADALHLPCPSASLDLISAAFGFRNLVDYEAGLAEFYRALKPGGQIAILECNQPEGLVGRLYNLYFQHLLPRLGALVSSQNAYTYLPASVARFPRPPRMLSLIAAAGFVDGQWSSYTLGVTGLYQATKPIDTSGIELRSAPESL